MRGVFIKIYLAFLATSLIAAVVTLVLSIFYREWSKEPTNLVAPTAGYISAANLMLQRGGESLLIEWLLAFQRHPSVNAYVFDDAGTSLLSGVPDAVRRYALSAESYQAQVNSLSRSEILVKAPLQSSSGRFYLLVVEFVHPLAVFNLPAYLAWGLLVSLAILAIWGLVLAGYLTRPLLSMKSGVKAFAKGDWAARMPSRLSQRKDEIGELSREFDHMAGKLGRLMEDQKQLVRDVSHELRSPLARSSVALELARMDAVPEQQEYLDRIELETQRLSELIGDLLSMARLETEQNENNWQVLDCEEVLCGIVDDARFERPDGDIRFLPDRQEYRIKADPHLLVAAFENIIRNALLHTHSGTSVDIGLRRQVHTILVTIRDYGPGVAEDKLEDLLKPFVRNEDARERSQQSLNQGHRGFGLGLAIADKVVAHHQGTLRLSNHHQGGLQVDIELPVYRGKRI